MTRTIKINDEHVMNALNSYMYALSLMDDNEVVVDYHGNGDENYLTVEVTSSNAKD